ncbi:MAG: hypothetical protein OXF23_03160, partial [Candidatus Dadabacteria bacterium]|nr:hypothetical protein [Candidatus Dadabacteria bacterium]
MADPNSVSPEKVILQFATSMQKLKAAGPEWTSLPTAWIAAWCGSAELCDAHDTVPSLDLIGQRLSFFSYCAAGESIEDDPIGSLALSAACAVGSIISSSCDLSIYVPRNTLPDKKQEDLLTQAEDAVSHDLDPVIGLLLMWSCTSWEGISEGKEPDFSCPEDFAGLVLPTARRFVGACARSSLTDP